MKQRLLIRFLPAILTAVTFSCAVKADNGKTEKESSQKADPFDFGDPAINRQFSVTAQAVIKQLKLRGVISSGNNKMALIEPAGKDRILMVRKGGIIRVEIVRENSKDKDVSPAWIEMLVVDIGEDNATLSQNGSPRQLVTLL